MKFSICIPAYGVEKYIETCLDSILSQQYNDYEIIIVDDGSKDNSGAIADKYAIKYENISVIHQENKGLFHARITAMKAARGEYILNIDSDDWLTSNSLSEIEKAIKQSNCDLLIFNYYLAKNEIDKKIVSIPNYLYSSDTSTTKAAFFSEVLHHNIFNKVIKRNLLRLDLLQNYPRINMTEDWIHSFFPIINANKICCIETPLYYYRVSESSMTQKFNPSIYDSTIIIYSLLREHSQTIIKFDKNMNPDRWLLKKVSKTMAYTKSYVDNTETYMKCLSIISKDVDIYNAYKRSSNRINVLYRIPFWLLYSNKTKLLLLIKKASSTLGRLR